MVKISSYTIFTASFLSACSLPGLNPYLISAYAQLNRCGSTLNLADATGLCSNVGLAAATEFHMIMITHSHSQTLVGVTTCT